jgi:50S ribosomal subunit-associated GTPase HflX
VEGITISAKQGTHVGELQEIIAARLFPQSIDLSFTVPHQALYALHPFTATGRARIVDYVEAGANVEASLSQEEWHALQAVGAKLSVFSDSQDEAL